MLCTRKQPTGQWIDYASFYEMRIPCHGYHKGNIKVTVDDKTQMVSVRGIQLYEKNERGYHSQQMREFSHSTTLPAGVYPGTLQAFLHGNELIVKVSKVNHTTPSLRRIPIR